METSVRKKTIVTLAMNVCRELVLMAIIPTHASVFQVTWVTTVKRKTTVTLATYVGMVGSVLMVTLVSPAAVLLVLQESIVRVSI